jgi:hypothetical protein
LQTYKRKELGKDEVKKQIVSRDTASSECMTNRYLVAGVASSPAISKGDSYITVFE